MCGSVRCIRCRQVYVVPSGVPAYETRRLIDWINNHPCAPSPDSANEHPVTFIGVAS